MTSSQADVLVGPLRHRSCPSLPEALGKLLLEGGVLGSQPSELLAVGVQLLAQRAGARPLGGLAALPR